MTIYKRVVIPFVKGYDLNGTPRHEKNLGGGSLLKHIFLNTDRGLEYGKSFGGDLIEKGRKVLTEGAPEFDLLTAEQREDLNTRPDLNAWHTRHGGPAANLRDVKPSTFKQLDKGRAEIRHVDECQRCGGRGYFPTVQHGACYGCGGQCYFLKWSKLYTAERLEKMNATRDKRREKAEAEREALVAKQEAEAPDYIAANLEAYPELKTVLEYDGEHNDFISQTASKVERYVISEKQALAAIDAVKREAAKVEERANAKPLTDGRQDIEGEVLSTKWVDSHFGGALKMLVKLDTGSKVWGTVPSAIDVDKGDRVKFVATVERSDDDPLFGFYKRPSKAEVLESV